MMMIMVMESTPRLPCVARKKKKKFKEKKKYINFYIFNASAAYNRSHLLYLYRRNQSDNLVID